MFLYLDDTFYDKKNNDNKRETLEWERTNREIHYMFVYNKEKIKFE